MVSHRIPSGADRGGRGLHGKAWNMTTKHKVMAYLLGATAASCMLLWPKAYAADDNAALGAALALHAVDYAQTLEIAHSCRYDLGPDPYRESNPILGRCPTHAAVGRYFLGTAAAMTVLHITTKQRYTTYGWLALEAAVVGRNFSIGLRGRF